VYNTEGFKDGHIIQFAGKNNICNIIDSGLQFDNLSLILGCNFINFSFILDCNFNNLSLILGCDFINFSFILGCDFNNLSLILGCNFINFSFISLYYNWMFVLVVMASNNTGNCLFLHAHLIITSLYGLKCKQI